MTIDLEQLRELVKHARRIGIENKCLTLAMEYIESIHAILIRRTDLLKEASGWIGPSDHNPKELAERIQKELEYP